MESPYINISSEELKPLLNKKTQVLDVRTANERAAGFIANSSHADVMNGQLLKIIDKLDKEQAVYVYCRSGNRSKMACSILSRQGFTKVYNLVGGYQNWK